MKNQQSFKEHFNNALLSFLWNFFIYFLLIVPFDLWKKAVIRLSVQKQQGKLNISKITSFWPFLSFFRAFFFEFLFDGFIFIGWFIGIIVAIYAYSQTEKIETMLLMIVGTYYSPIGLSLIRDILQFLMMPLKKFIDWCLKPAQYMDFTIIEKSKRENLQSDKDKSNMKQVDKKWIDPNDL
jgi:hypothetical protein